MSNNLFKILNVIKLAHTLDNNAEYKSSDYIFNKILKLAQDVPFQLAEGLETNDPKDVMSYFMGFAFDMVQRKPTISQKRLTMEVEKKVNDKIAEMSEENKNKFSNLLEDVLKELKNQSFWNKLPETSDDQRKVVFDPNSPGFDNAFKYILDVEGGYTDFNPSTGDPRTNLGIIQSEYDKYRSNRGLAQQSVSNITKDEAKEIYFNNYWVPTQADLLYEKLPKTAITIFDFAVNSGLGGASSVVAKTLNIPSSRFDGKMIDTILDTGASMGDEKLSRSLIERRFVNYDEIISRDPRKSVYRKGWHNRLDKLSDMINQVNVV